jgi:hypothetical protein
VTAALLEAAGWLLLTALMTTIGYATGRLTRREHDTTDHAIHGHRDCDWEAR